LVAASPAAASGLRGGDRIVAVDGHRAASTVDVSKAIQRAGGSGAAVRLTVLRDGRSVVLRPAVPKRDAATGTPRLGLQFAVDRIGTTRLGPLSAVRRSVGVSWGIVRDSVTGLASTVTGDRKNLGTVVGVVAEAQAPVQEGSGPEVFAFVSIALAVFNLLPFLPLDGGHILFAVIERFRRRPIPRVAFERYSVFGIVLMLMIFAVGLTNDVGRITGP
jgi:regulator of sigma E protease